MATPFLGEVKIISWNFAPKGWAFCNGQFLPINQNQALFSILGTTYGGNGQTSFALPDLQGRTPIGRGQGPGLADYILGQAGGRENATITTNQLPSHTHNLTAYAGGGTTGTPSGTTYLAAGPITGSGPNASQLKTYATNGPNVVMGPGSTTNTGGDQPMPTLSPYLTMFWIIATEGIFPTRN